MKVVILLLIMSISGSIASTGDLAGTITDQATHVPLPGIIVKIIETGDSTATDSQGDYFFGGLADAGYTLLVGGGNYVPAIVSASVGAFVCGDANSDGGVNVGDAVFLINYIFKGGAPPNPLAAGNANGDAGVNVGDAVYLINFIFKGGPGPVC